MLVMDTIGKRARAARKYAGMTQTQAADASGVKQSDISKIERGDTERSTGLIALARAYGVDPTWLDSGNGAIDGDIVPAGSKLLLSSNTEPGPDVRGMVPLISWVRAGAWNPPCDRIEPGEAERWMPCIAPHSKGTFVLRVKGDSMTSPHGNTRSYPEGSFIFVDPERRNPMNGDRIIALLVGADEVTFKVYKSEDGRQWLQPLNPTHEPIRERFTVLGTIIGKWEDG